MNLKTGIAVVGTILVDKLYELKAYPQSGELAKIEGVSFSVGGMVPNDSVDIKKIAPQLPVIAVGKVGNDDDGRFAVQTMMNNEVDVSGVSFSAEEKTSFTDVMSVIGGQRTFFTYPGASATFGYDDIPWDTLKCKMFHLGYFLLLDKIDNGDGLKILKEAKQRGFLTSIDMVSENSNRYSCVIPCLPFVDNLIVNELEASRLCGMEYDGSNLSDISQKLMGFGVTQRVIIHTPELSVCRSCDEYIELPSSKLIDGYVKGKTGAGDTFCSGALIGIYYEKSNIEILEYAQMAAEASLSTVDATSGLVPLDELKVLSKKNQEKRVGTKYVSYFN